MKLHVLILSTALMAAAATAQDVPGGGSPENVQVVELLGGGYFFRPEKVTVKANIEVLRRHQGAP